MSSIALIALAGCYDLERLDPGPENPYLLVDDFEEDDTGSNLHGFGPWTVFPFNWQNSPEPTIEHTRGLTSDGALVGEFVANHPGNDRYTGVSLGITSTRPLLDVRRYRALHVTTRFIPDAATLPETTRFYGELNCNSAPPVGTVSELYVGHVMPVTNDWQQFRLDIEEFSELNTEPPKIAGGPPSCLPLVDGIRFTVSTNLPNQ
jgi:hypothetical protein